MDASNLWLGAVLLQKQDDNEWYPICYYSRRTASKKARYHSFELVTLAIVCALEKYRVYMIGIEFVIQTDCNSLKLLEKKRDMSPSIARWFVRLSEFNYRIEYHPGEQNVVAETKTYH